MRLELDTNPNLNRFTALEPGLVKINNQIYNNNVVVLPERLIQDWAQGGFEGLTEADFTVLAELGADILLIGTGERQRFPHPSLLRPLMAARIGFEFMDVAAACRTYNVLMSEDRKVAAALILK